MSTAVGNDIDWRGREIDSTFDRRTRPLVHNDGFQEVDRKKLQCGKCYNFIYFSYKL